MPCVSYKMLMYDYSNLLLPIISGKKKSKKWLNQFHPTNVIKGDRLGRLGH